MEWITLERFKGLYEFGSNGLVKCLPKIKNGYKIIITPGSICSRGKYYVLHLTDINGNRKQEKVHRLIAEAHISNPFNLPYINHLDNNGLNNNKTNLEWSTDLDNRKHAKEIGCISAGQNHPNSKLIDKYVIEIYKSNLLQVELAKKYGVRQSVISSIKTGRTWNRLTKHLWL